MSIVYSPADTNIARQQLEYLRNTLVFINNTRTDSYASLEQKISDLSALEDIKLDRNTSLAILSLSASRWSAVSEEATTVLDEVMREPIRESQLASVNQKVPTLVSLSFPEEQSAIITTLVQAFIVPNSLYDQQLTDAARQKARDNVTPVTRIFMANETIIQEGKVITITDYEALQQFGLAQPKNRWQDVVSSLALALLTTGVFIFYYRRNPGLFSGNLGLRKLAVLVSLFLLFLFVGRLFIPGHAVIPYVYPVMGYALTVSALFSSELAVISIVPLAYLVPYGLPDAQILTIYYILGSLFGVFVLRKAQRLTSFFWSAAAIAISGAIVAVAYRIIQPTADWIGVATLALAAVINGIASASIGLIFHCPVLRQDYALATDRTLQTRSSTSTTPHAERTRHIST